jgi:hypothetical protein
LKEKKITMKDGGYIRIYEWRLKDVNRRNDSERKIEVW